MLLLSSDENVVNLDNVTQVARDCLLARMEAIILQVTNKLGYEILDREGVINFCKIRYFIVIEGTKNLIFY